MRDNAFAKQVKNYVQTVSLSDTWRDRYLKRLDKWEKESRHTSDLITQKLKAELSRVKTRIDRLTDAYLDQTLELREFQEKKNSLMRRKKDIEEKLCDFERRGNHWLELTRNWILEANSAENLALQEDYKGMNLYSAVDRTVFRSKRPFSAVLSSFHYSRETHPLGSDTHGCLTLHFSKYGNEKRAMPLNSALSNCCF